MARLVMAHPVAAGRGAEHLAWCHDIRARRDELDRSRRRAGITRQVVWSHPPSDMAIVRVDGDDPAASLAALAELDDPFDRWYRERERDLHRGPLLSDGAEPEVLADFANGEPDELDMFIAVALVLRPGRTESFRASVAANVASGYGDVMLERWNIRRLTLWFHPTAVGEVVIYEAIGDLSEMIRSMAESDDPVVVAQRAAHLDRFGLDVTRESWPIPHPGFSWSAGPTG